MKEPLIERLAFALAYWLEARGRARKTAVKRLRFRPWENIGEPVQMDLGSGYASFTSTPITVERDAEYGVAIGKGGVMQMRVRRPA